MKSMNFSSFGRHERQSYFLAKSANCLPWGIQAILALPSDTKQCLFSIFLLRVDTKELLFLLLSILKVFFLFKYQIHDNWWRKSSERLFNRSL